ncbi:DNA polymerase IV [Desulfotalea psychrophila]|nr:DNA polymerase IV [Desulfotalea psychrophila]
MRKIIHIDMDAFFASIEQRDRPELRKKPLIVGGLPRGRGVVATCCYEARRYGIHSAMSANRAYKLCPHAVFVKPRMVLYKEVSLQIMAIFREYTKKVEPLSLDEAFLDVTEYLQINGSATLLAREICALIKLRTDLSASAGVSYNKFLAKIASDLKKPGGISTVPPEEARQFIDRLSIGKFYGVGKITKSKMQSLGIQTGKDLRQYSKDFLMKRFGKAGSFFFYNARGLDERPVCPYQNRKSIGKETTLVQDTNRPEEIRDILINLSSLLGKALENNSQLAQTLTLKIRYSDFTTTTRSLSLQKPFSCPADIEECLPSLLTNCNLTHKPIRLLGISLSKLTYIGSAPRPIPLPFPKDRRSNCLNRFFAIKEESP